MTNTELATTADQTESALLPAATPTADATAMLLQHAQTMQAAHQIATAMCSSDLVPAIYKGKPDNGAAAILYGAELGLNPIQSLQQIFVVHGTPAIYSRTMVALVKSKGYMVQTVESTPESVTVAGRDPRTGIEETATWTYERARKAGYTKNAKYDTDPQAMLYAKAATEVCRKLAPEVLLGISYSKEELDLDNIAPAPRRVQSTQSGVDGLKAKLGIGSPVVESAVAAQAEPVAEPVADKVKADSPATAAQLKKLRDLLKVWELTDAENITGWLMSQIGRQITAPKDLTRAEAESLLAFIEAEQAKGAQAKGGDQ